MEANALTHHGILGMKWGVRRFQNKDGTLTKAGKKRYADDDDDQKKTSDDSKSGSSASSKPKSVKDMTDDEIYEAIARAQLEDRLTALRPETGGAGRTKSMSEMSSRELAEAIQRKQLENQWAALNPKQVSAGEKFAKTVMTKVVAPAAMKAGEQFLNKALVKAGDKLLGERAVETTDALRKQYERLTLQKQIKDLKNPKKDDNEKLKKEFEKIQLEKAIEELNNPSSIPKTKSWDDMLKRQQYEDAKATEGLRRAATNLDNSNKAWRSRFARDKVRDEYNEWENSKKTQDEPTNKQDTKPDSSPKTEEKTVFGGTVEGVGRTTKKHGFDFVEAEGWTETAKSYTSGSNSNVADQGQIFVNSFLGLPLKED